MRIVLFDTLASGLVLAILATPVSSCFGQEGQAHQRALIKGRQARMWSNHGTEVYLAPDIDPEDKCPTEEELGNYTVSRRSSVRRVFVSPTVHGNLRCPDWKVHVGVVEIEHGARVKEIHNKTVVDGDVSASDAVIGGVLVEEGVEIDSVDIETTIKGEIHAR